MGLAGDLTRRIDTVDAPVSGRGAGSVDDPLQEAEAVGVLVLYRERTARVGHGVDAAVAVVAYRAGVAGGPDGGRGLRGAAQAVVGGAPHVAIASASLAQFADAHGAGATVSVGVVVPVGVEAGFGLGGEPPQQVVGHLGDLPL